MTTTLSFILSLPFRRLRRLLNISKRRWENHQKYQPDEEVRYRKLIKKAGSDWQAEIEIAETLRHHPHLSRIGAIEEVLAKYKSVPLQ